MLKFKILPGRPELPLPKYQTEGSSGLDLQAAETCVLQPGKWVMVGTGLAVELPRGFEGQIRPRSGLAAKSGITVLNSPGTIDFDYVHELKVILINHGQEPYSVMVGDRIAQLVIARVEQLEIGTTEELSTTTRKGGFGSTGR